MATKQIARRWEDINMAELDLVKLISHFAQSNRAEGKAPKTVQWYTEMLFGLVRFLRASDRAALLSSFNVVAARQFVIHEQERGLSPFSVQSKVRAMKAFASWLVAEGYTSDNVLANLKLPRTPIRMVEPLTSAEIDALLAAQNPLTHIGCRNIAILVTLLDTGLRCSELCSLMLEDAHIDEGYLKVMGKGSKERVVPIGGSAQKVLWRYLFHFRPDPVDEEDDRLFLSLDGRPLQPNALKLLLRRWGRKAGVPRLHPHLCRHTYATNFLVHKCGDVFRLKQTLGHTTLEMVNRYVHYASAHSMLRGHVSSPVDRQGIGALRGNKVDRALKKLGRSRPGAGE